MFSHLSKKRTFFVFAILGMGVPGSALLLWYFQGIESILFRVFMVANAFFWAYVWALIMWHVVVKTYATERQD
jgi:hypothetical protein